MVGIESQLPIYIQVTRLVTVSFTRSHYTNKMVKARKYVVKKHFEGLPKREDFEIVEYDLPSLEDGDILLKTEWVSVDPYLRLYNKMQPVPFDQFAPQLGVVVESKDPSIAVGTRIYSNEGWCEYSIININSPDSQIPFHFAYKLPELNGLSPSLGLGAMGASGIAAYFGLLEICKPKSGETVVVSAAAGSIGSLVGQIAKMKGCKVIGFTGSDQKVIWLEEELGFDKAFNYKTVNIEKALKAAAPNGVDCYFDNVGGQMSSLIINQMNEFGRVSVCGCISEYNEDPAEPLQARSLQVAIISKQLKIEGFLCYRWKERYPEAFAELRHWIESGKLKVLEHVTEGFENIFDAFLGLFSGENIGKSVVKLW